MTSELVPDDATPEGVLGQERRLVLAAFGNDDAVELGLIAVSIARERSLPIVVEIRAHEQVLFRAALPGSSVANDNWVARKTRLVEELGHSTLYQRLSHEAAGLTFTEATGLSDDDYAAHGGGFPISVVDPVGDVDTGSGEFTAPRRVGVMIVSGLPQLEDHRLVVECLEALQKRS